MKIVVIGGTGLIGSKTVDILRQGGQDLVAGLAQNGDGLRADQAGAADDDDLHDLPFLVDGLRPFARRAVARGERLLPVFVSQAWRGRSG